MPCCRVAHTTWRNNYTGSSLHGFHIWSDDAMLCAKPKAFANVEGNQAMCSHCKPGLHELK